MDFQRFVAWEKLPTIVLPKDATESSSSSSKSGSSIENEAEADTEAKSKVVAKSESFALPTVEIPPSVKHVLEKLEMAQLERAKKEISKKLYHILDNVNRIYERYRKDEGIDPEIEKEYQFSQTWEEKSRRSRFLDEITDVLDENVFKSQELKMLLESFENWRGMLKTDEFSSKVYPSDDEIKEMEEYLQQSITRIEVQIQCLIKIFRSLLEEKTKPRRKSVLRAGLFKAWKEKVADVPQEAEPLSAERMMEDEVLTLSRTQDINSMLMEMADSSVFYKGETVAVKYIAATVSNLSKAFSLLTRQCRNLKLKCDNLTSPESRKQDPQVATIKRELQMVLEKKAALERQIQNAEERCRILIITNEVMQRELQDANERAMVVSKASFSRTPSSKLLAKSQSDTDKERRGKKDETSSTKLHAKLKKKAEDEESSDEKQAAKTSSSFTKRDGSLPPLALPAQAGIMKQVMKDAAPEVVIAQMGSDTGEAELTESGKTHDKLLDHPLTDKLKSAQDARQSSKLRQWKKLQGPILKTPPQPTEGTESHPGEVRTEADTQRVEELSLPTPVLDSDQDIKGSSSELKLPQLSTEPAESVPGSGVQATASKRAKPKLSLKGTAEQLVENIKKKKIVKFLADNLAQRPLTAPDSLGERDEEFPGKSLPQVTLGAGVTTDSATKAQDGGQMWTQKELKDRQEEIQEQTEAKPFSKMQAVVPQPKKVEKAEDIACSLGTKLQEIARERGGVIDAKAIQEFFEEQSKTYQVTSPGPPAESQLVKRPSKITSARKSFLLPSRIPSTATISKKEKQSASSTDEKPSEQDAHSALQAFQAAVLACLEDKLEKLKKSPPGSSKRPVKLPSTDPQTQQLLQAIDRKLEECFLMKQKVPGPQKKQKLVKSTPSKGEFHEEKEIKPAYEEKEVKAVSQELLHGSFSPSGTEQGQPIRLEEPFDVKTLQEEQQQEEQLKKAQEEEEQEEQEEEEEEEQDKHLPELKEEEDLDKVSQPKEEEQLWEDMPDEQSEQQIEDLEPEEQKQGTEQFAEEQQEDLGEGKEAQQKEAKAELELKSLLELEAEKEQWYLKLQEQLQEEKQRLKEEQARLQQERQMLDEEEDYVEQWQQLLEKQQGQWEQEQLQREEQERLWQVQLEHWQHLRQENEAQERYWWAQREQQKAQQHMLQEDIQRLQEEYKEHLKLKGECAEEQWRWQQLKEWHAGQQRIWQQEDEDHERKKSQWQEQLGRHEEQMKALRQEQLEKQQQYKKWQEEQEERQKELQRLWKKRWQEQQEKWHHQMHLQKVQLHQCQEKGRKLAEKQQKVKVEVEKSLPSKLKIVVGTSLGQPTKPYKVSPTQTDRKLSTTPERTPTPSTEFEQEAFELETTVFPKLLPKPDEDPVVGTTEKRYSINVEAQRKNLELLKEATQKAEIPPDLYTKTEVVIKQALQNNVERLALLFKKYTSLYHLQEARKKITIQLEAAKEANDSIEMQNLYKMVENLDTHQKKVVGKWMVKQNAVEKKRRYCFEKMITLFTQFRLNYNLCLSSPSPLMVKGGADTQKGTQRMPQIGSVVWKHKVFRSPLISAKKPKDFTFSAVVREPSKEQIESLWKTDITELSIPLGPKVPVSLLWSEAYGFPDIPRFLELDISSVRKKPLQNIRTRIQNIPRWKISGYDFMHL